MTDTRKYLATTKELESPFYREFMNELNHLAAKLGLQEFTTYSRIWEYPWLWKQIGPLKGQNLHLLDIGSRDSPFPWFLATQGFHVIISDVTARSWSLWKRANRILGVAIRKRILDAEYLALPPASVDVYLSVSVIEHVQGKARAIAEAARVLRPGGLLIATFDICEPSMGMNFPSWNGRALTMSEFDNLFKESKWFDAEVSRIPWNTHDIADYLAWHRTTAPWHNYVTGASVVRRNRRPWVEPVWKGLARKSRLTAHTLYQLLGWRWGYVAKTAVSGAIKTLRSTLSTGRDTVLGPAIVRTLSLIGESFFLLLGVPRRSMATDLSCVRRVLVVRPDQIGDVVMTTPFLRELRRNLTNAWITLIVKPDVYNLVELCPYVNEILTYDWRASAPIRPIRRSWRALKLAATRLWRRQFELAILPRWDTDHFHGAFLLYVSGASSRVGYSENVTGSKSRANRGFDRFLTHPLGGAGHKHEVEHNLDVIRFLGGKVEIDTLELWINEIDERFADQLWHEHDITDRELLVGIGPGAGAAKRRWPIERYQELGLWILRQLDGKVIIVGGAREELLGEQLSGALGVSAINLVGKTTLRQAAAILKRTSLFIGNDAGPMHIAAAMGVPVVEISCHPTHGSSFSINSPCRFHPWISRHVVVQPDRFNPGCKSECTANEPHCILANSVEKVKVCATSLMKKEML